MSSPSKHDLRRAGRERRARRSHEEVERAGLALASHVDAIARPSVALYAGIDGEPPTLPLLTALIARGARVLLPVLRSDMDLEWAPVTSLLELIRSPYGLLEPGTPSLGTEGIREAELVLAPGLAVDRRGVRLGQGGGCYDRALTRVSAPVYVVVFDDEIVEWLPTEPHDRSVNGTLTPAAGLARIDAGAQAGLKGSDPTSDTTQS